MVRLATLVSSRQRRHASEATSFSTARCWSRPLEVLAFHSSSSAMKASESILAAALDFVTHVSDEVIASAVATLETGTTMKLASRLSRDAAQRYEALIAVWQSDGPSLSAMNMALMLSGMAYSVAVERRSRRVDLVWTGPDSVQSTFRSTGPALLELIESASRSIYLVTFAAYKVPEVAEALQAALNRGVRVVFVLESDEVSGGKVGFDPLPYLCDDTESSAEVYHWPVAQRRRDERGRYGTLHAKFAVADRQCLFVSSANLTEFAFELNIELGVMLRGGTAPAEAAGHIDELIRRGVLRRQVNLGA